MAGLFSSRATAHFDRLGKGRPRVYPTGRRSLSTGSQERRAAFFGCGALCLGDPCTGDCSPYAAISHSIHALKSHVDRCCVSRIIPRTRKVPARDLIGTRFETVAAPATVTGERTSIEPLRP